MNYGEAPQRIRYERGYAIEVFRAVRAEPLSPDARTYVEAYAESEDPDWVVDRLDHDDKRIGAAAAQVWRFESAGTILRDLGAE